MTKRILTVFLAVSVFFACMMPAVVSADSSIPYTDERVVSVGADIELRKTGEVYADGPLDLGTFSSESSIPKVDFKATLDMTNVQNTFNYYFGDELMQKFKDQNNYPDGMFDISYLKQYLYVAGEMTVTINIPTGFTVNESFLGTKQMDGFSGSKAIHEETTTQRKLENGKIIIKTQVKDPSDSSKKYVPGLTLYNSGNLNEYLGEISLECTDNTIGYGTYEITGKVEGYTKIYLDRDFDGADVINNTNEIGMIKYETPLVSEKVIASAPATTPGSGGGYVPSKPDVTVDFSVNGDKQVVDAVTGKNGKVTIDLDKITPPEIEGYISDGKWYTDPAHTNEVSGKYTVTENTTLYTTYINMTVPSVLIEDHYGYIQGYPDGNVKPTQNVTREEVAALLYRLLKEHIRESLRNNNSYFEDVEEDRWSHSEIAAMVKGKYIKGYEDGTYRPGKPITRAEFATLITRFIDEDTLPAVETTFDDIGNHWAKEYIEKAANHMFIAGYEDGSFKPDKYITRAEAMTILNKILVRHVDDDGLHEDAKHWPDNDENEWYYHHVLEATNSHDHNRRENSHLEDWTSRNELIDWTTH